MSTPAVEIRSFAVTVPAGTPVASPVTTAITIPARVVSAVHWKVPPGPSGNLGWRLTMNNGVAVIPTGGGWIIADNEDATWALQAQPDSGYWEVTGYNTGTYPHTIYIDFLLDLVTDASSTALIPNDQLTSAASSTASGS